MDGARDDQELERLLSDAETAVAALAAHPLVATNGRSAITMTRRLEAIGRRVRAAQVALVGAIDRSGVYREDGHRTVKAMVGWAADLSPAEAGRRASAARTLRDMPALRAAFDGGTVGVCHLGRVARVHANLRVREALEAVDEDLAVVASRMTYRELDRYLTDWERLVDEDGAGDRAERSHRNRNFRIRRHWDGTVGFEGGCGGVQGETVRTVHDAYLQAELEADWAEARARLGEAATAADLVRTDEQRRMDALERMALAGADAHFDRTGHRLTTDLVQDQVTFERMLAKLTGVDPGPDPRLATWWSDLSGRLGATVADEDQERPEGDAPVPLVDFRCSTLDGSPLDPAEVALAALLGHTRRIIARADGVVLDVGRSQRLFTGRRHLAAILASTHCIWPGCTVANVHAQADHLEPWNDGGRTCPENGAPCCGKHNRYRNHGFGVERDPVLGDYVVTRPDGSRIA